MWAGPWARRSRREPGPGRGNARGLSPAGAHLVAARRTSVCPVAGGAEGGVGWSLSRLRGRGGRLRAAAQVDEHSPFSPLPPCEDARCARREPRVLARKRPPVVQRGFVPIRCVQWTPTGSPQRLGGRLNVTKGAAAVLSVLRNWRFF